MRSAAAPTALTQPTADTVGYARVSTEDQARPEKTSIEDQRAAIRQLAVSLSRELRDEDIYVDAGVSGSTDNRPAFRAMAAYCEAHPRSPRSPGYVLILNDSRLGRFKDPERSAWWRVTLKDAGWIVRFAEGDDVQDPIARPLMRALGSTQASLYRQNVVDNAKRGVQGTAREGFWQNEAPFGYRRAAKNPDSTLKVFEIGQRKPPNVKVKLTPGPQPEVDLVRWLFETFSKGEYSLCALGREAAARWPGKAWSTQGVRQVLVNPAYVGDVVWCKRPHDEEERRLTPVRPEAEHVVCRDAHPPLVDRATFADCQARLSVNRKHTRAVAGRYPLSGLLVCAQCGRHYTGGGRGSNPKNIGNDPYRYAFYRCSGGSGVTPQCDGRLGTVKKRWIESTVVREVARVVRHPSVRALVAEEIDRLLTATHGDQATERGRLEAVRHDLAAARGRIVGALSRGKLSEDDAAKELGRIVQQDREAETALQQLAFRGRSAARIEEERSRLLALADDFEGAAGVATGPALRRLLEPWLERATVDKDRRVVELVIRKVPDACSSLDLVCPPGRG